MSGTRKFLFRQISTALIIIGFAALCCLFFLQPSYQTDRFAKGDGFFALPLDAQSGTYYVRGDVGVQSRSVKFLVDTGSDHVWVKDSFVSRPALSGMLSEGFSIEYVGGRASGYRLDEQLTIAGTSWNQSIGVVTQTSEHLYGIEGIIGISRRCRDSALCVAANWRLRRNVVGFVVTDSRSMTGKMIAGVIDPSHCKQNMTLTWVSNIGNFFWMTKVGLILGEDILMSEARAIWDTGTTRLYFASYIHLKILDSLPRDSCKVRTLPDLHVMIGKRSFRIPSTSYARDTGFNTCEWLFGPMDERWRTQSGADMILGWAFLRAHYVVFDSQGDRLGICDIEDSYKPTLRVSR